MAGELEKLQLHMGKEVEYPVSINARFQDDWTALHYAVSNGNLSIVEFLIQSNADLSAFTTNKRTVLHIAIYKNSPQIIG